MEDDFQMLECLFWQLLQKTETCLARTTRRDVEYWCKRDQAHGKPGKQNSESIDTGKKSWAKRAKFWALIIAYSESMSASVLGCTHKLITAVHPPYPFLYLHYLSCDYSCQNVNQGNSSWLVCLLDLMDLVKHACLELNGFVFKSWVHYLLSDWPWLSCLTSKQSRFFIWRIEFIISLPRAC